MKQQESTAFHNIAPVFNTDSKILILGSFPSVKSREEAFFYAHRQNRFWKVLSTVLDCPLPLSVEEKKEMLLSHGIAVWDVIASCDIVGSSDSTIKNVVVNDLSEILAGADIRQIYANGGKSHSLYDKYMKKCYKREAVRLPSTSPANAAFGLERLVKEWKQILDYLADEEV